MAMATAGAKKLFPVHILAGGDRTAWLPFLHTYRTLCRAPEPAFQRVLESVRAFPYQDWLKSELPHCRPGGIA
jgi:hypothetical protein